MKNFIRLLPVAGAPYKMFSTKPCWLIQVTVLEDNCMVTFKPVALLTQAIAQLATICFFI